ncbi:hypothetical protein NHX12_002494 [Muraenolepis orangiensis]|uniref:Protein SPT2 homolog n=1 Tax=Muraenolepis orangiensis TaxID=630683 RepID=A0A9Q0DWA3_9TELE|nr:hypothetical protein NHX12_002494 [Muraenolepis orangiensis]
MDFDNILSIASQNQGLSSVQQKRYSLQTGPPKKDPKVKGVNSSAVQAFLKKQQCKVKQKESQMKKEKEILTAKRVELKSDRKARAMASRTKDNFRGYNGVPVVEEPKKRRSKGDNGDERPIVNCYDPDDEDNFEYEQTDSEPEEEPEKPRRNGGSSGRGAVKASAKKPTGPSKPAPPPLNFADLLKLAEKKQFEPVEVKSKLAKEEGRLRTADEIREMELERKVKPTPRPLPSHKSSPASDLGSKKDLGATLQVVDQGVFPRVVDLGVFPRVVDPGVFHRVVGLEVFPKGVGLELFPKGVGLGVGHKPGLEAAVSRVPLKVGSGLGMHSADRTRWTSKTHRRAVWIHSEAVRRYEDEEDEYDSEMEDFIDNEDGEQEEVSKHIREIFGYDRTKYKEESDYALRFMESSWRDLQKEEARR